jgi:hypothetical protein
LLVPRYGDAVDEGPQDRRCLGTTFGIVQRDVQLPNLLAVDLGEPGVKPWCGRGRRLDRLPQLHLLGLQHQQLGLEARAAEALRDGIIETAQLLSDAVELVLVRLTPQIVGRAPAVELRMKGADKLLDQFWCHQPGL